MLLWTFVYRLLHELEKEMANHSSTHSCLENSMGGEAWWATIHGVTKSRTLLSYFTSLHFYMNMCFQFSWDILRSGIVVTTIVLYQCRLTAVTTQDLGSFNTIHVYFSPKSQLCVCWQGGSHFPSHSGVRFCGFAHFLVLGTLSIWPAEGMRDWGLRKGGFYGPSLEVASNISVHVLGLSHMVIPYYNVYWEI